MTLVQTAFLTTTLASPIATGTGIALPLDSYTQIDTLMSNGDTIELVIDRSDATEREIVLATKVSNGNYTIDGRGLYGTTEQAHDEDDEVTNDDTPGYYQNAMATRVLGYAAITGNFSSSSIPAVQVTGLSKAVTIPTGGCNVKITVFLPSVNTNAGGNAIDISIWDGVVGVGTQLQVASHYDTTSNGSHLDVIAYAASVSAGSKTYNVGMSVGGSTGNIFATATKPAFILIERV